MEETLARLKEQYADPDALRQHLTAYLAQAGMSQEKAAKEAGISTSSLNQWLQGKYKGDNEAVAEKVLRWLASRERKISVAAPLADSGYIETETSKKIMATLNLAQLLADLCAIYGGAGVGKTMTIERYASLNPNVWVVTMRPDTATFAAALEEIGDVMGVRSNWPNRLAREICKKIKGTGGLLIIDEAQFASVAAIEAIRSIHDATGVGVVLCGNESVYTRLTGGARAANFAQLFSRVGKRLRLTKASSQDVTAIAGRYGITGQKELAILKGISEKPGALRGLVKTLRLASLLAGSGASTQEHIAAAWRDLGGEA
ncbi:AAA family ATPase [Geomonas propionica]|uniref:AAA family ATPase n=1 Tax=Geomonas propionica TaxID=2798582 RepID=A0ABS0YQE9_9BACT|nr:AAA family ATPase [Geomonas propionica]MBJ6800206.1 AAA family ATPase [Geomonas propionica]